LPGLIEGAHSGVGLGHEFLRHIERTRVLVHLVEPMPVDGTSPLANYQAIRQELELYSLDLAQKPEIVVVSKAELPGSETVREELQAALGREVLAMSAVTGQGMSRLVGAVVRALAELPAGAPV
jgi:GTP-binding protein